ncbi:hypothetical protein ABZV67_36100 [Streptomyces sp. NPDC005065]|uniref:hypothetical protein n=1 Tax=unclassified Streptomyces TaxID=2593676 RepID=UPI0033B0C5CD
MRDVHQRQRVESVHPHVTAVRPQWQDLFLAPVYGDTFVDDAEELWQEAPSASDHRRGSHRAA